MKGQCQCGLIKFKTPQEKPLKIYICHCWNCRHQSSSLFGMTASFPHFTIQEPVAGAVGTYTRSSHRGHTVGYFCKNCGSRLLHEHVRTGGEVASTVSVKSGCLDGLTKEDYRGAIHLWTSRALIDVPADAEQYEEDPPE